MTSPSCAASRSTRSASCRPWRRSRLSRTTQVAGQAREASIDRLLADPRWADHWMGYWQDVLAENPNILNPTLNNTGPFRWWLYESLLDNKPMDLFVTELVRMEGSERFGGPAGFRRGVAERRADGREGHDRQHRVPRRGDEVRALPRFAPAQESRRRICSSSPRCSRRSRSKCRRRAACRWTSFTHGGRKPLIKVTLEARHQGRAGVAVRRVLPTEAGRRQLAEDPNDTRDRLAALITAPQNERFAQVMANRVWAALHGPRHRRAGGRLGEAAGRRIPELLQWLGPRVRARRLRPEAPRAH